MDSSGIGNGIAKAFVAALIFVIIIVVAITSGIAWWIDDDTIESHTPITPEIIITTNGIKSDTLYIYKEP